MNILIPMAGKGTRFSAEGYTILKPLIDVNGAPMIQRVVENLAINSTYIFVVREEDLHTYSYLYDTLESLTAQSIIVQDKYEFQGQASSCLSAKEFINNDEPLLIANSDQIMGWDPEDFINHASNSNSDGIILTFDSQDTKNSYAKLDEDGIVLETAEKKVISPHACCGVFYWSKGRHFVNGLESMMEKNIKINNEYYVAPVYNENIAAGLNITIYKIDKHYPIGTPKDLEHFLRGKN